MTGPGGTAVDDGELRSHVARTEALLRRLHELPDPAVRAQALDAVGALVTLYGACLERVLRHTGEDTARTLAADELVGHLLLVHELHPDPPATRISRALAQLPGPSSAELLALDGTTARVRVRTSGCASAGCGSANDGPREQVEAAIAWAAPEVERVELAQDAAPGTLIPVEALLRSPVLEGGAR
ncbi:hypothetical protein GCM10018793_60150 [Streptomyces sulfonofaciens]|uniref:NifU family protein n=1 Tax=Streptomyces sulfonofaciens TaxID=68272 RepID=A0A919GM97_9ACTN|nr:NifU family protein [Streptomyces sulfonofaciens]GHH86804.1 hypothetical protein GCM10018793_60150 [Streptomyces sulfonofaciens]